MHKILFVLALIDYAHGSSIPIIGSEGASSFVKGEVESKDYVKTLLVLEESLDSQVASGLASYQERSDGWKLRKFSLGLGISGEIGIGPFKYGKALKQRFVYSR